MAKTTKYFNSIKGWEKVFDDGGSVINLSINRQKFNDECNQLGLTDNQYGDVKIAISKRKTPDSKSKATHYACVKVDENVNNDPNFPNSEADPF